MLYNLFNKVYYMFSKKPENNSSTKPNLEYSSYGISDKTDKESRINILVEIKNIKNTYYKYTYDKKYSEKLYNGILQETEYENGVLISNNSNIYDNEVIKYINYREELSKNTKNNYNLKKNFQTFYKYFILLLSLLFCNFIFGQASIRVLDFDVKWGAEQEVG